MKNLRTTLLSSAAGLAILGGSQAFGAGAVQYVKICSLYGAGFYYLPGTDTCIKIGGYVRAEIVSGANGNLELGPFNGNSNNRYTNNFTARERGYITADAREQTAYGTARGYISLGIESNNNGNEVPAGQFSSNRAFVQWAGFTAGLTESFYDFYSAPSVTYRNAFLPASDTSDNGWWVAGYTAQFGGGISATLSAEERRMTQNLDFGGPGGVLGGMTIPGTNGVLPGGVFSGAAGYGGWQVPDIIAATRVDQAWGSAQVMGALHEVNAGYYGTVPATGHPADAWGWAAGLGARINTPFIGPGDFFQAQFNATQGALRYVSFYNEGDWSKVSGASEGYGVMSDCVYGGMLAAGNATGCQLTSAWGVNASYEHYWTPQWHQSLFGSYMGVSYNGAANGMLCVGEGFGAGAGTTATATPGCNNNWSNAGIGSRLQWNVTPSFYVGAEAVYQQLNSAATSTGFLPGPAVLVNSGAMTVANQSNWTFTLRAHKDFLP
jgi:porin-like protein